MTAALLLAAPRSGSGKTTVATGLVAALRRRGISMRAAKCGPDYIDPAFLQAASGAPCVNLDSWAMPPPLLETVLFEAASGAELLLIESAMGLFDGVQGAALSTGAAAELAARFGIPVVLILDVSGQAQSAAAVLHGFASFDPHVNVAGVILNRVGSGKHRASIEAAISQLGIPVLGGVPRSDRIRLAERHLGLVQAIEHDDLAAHLDALADLIETHCDLDGLRSLAKPLSVVFHAATALPPPGQRIALAQDPAFSFAYPHLLSGWRRAGAEIVPFSPLADEAPPDTCDACWLPGGYPELHAAALANATRFKEGLRRFTATRPVHGECGGYMVLGEGLVDARGRRHAMAGLLSHATSFAERKLHLGYRTAQLLATCALGEAGTSLRGHEFHYASLIEPGSDAPLLELADATGAPLGLAGGRRGPVTGSFFHLIAGDDHPCTVSIPSIAATA